MSHEHHAHQHPLSCVMMTGPFELAADGVNCVCDVAACLVPPEVTSHVSLFKSRYP